MSYYRSFICDDGHRTEADFGSADSFTENFARLQKMKMIECACCGSTDVEAEVPSPRVNRGASPDAPGSAARKSDQWFGHYGEPGIVDQVGKHFIDAVREIHDGKAPERPLLGSATPDEIRRAAADGLVSFPHNIKKLDA